MRKELTQLEEQVPWKEVQDRYWPGNHAASPVLVLMLLAWGQGEPATNSMWLRLLSQRHKYTHWSSCFEIQASKCQAEAT